MELITLDEQFNDNSNNWWTGKDDSGWCDVADSCYIIEHTKDTSDYSAWKKIPLVESKAFSFEASFKFISGYEKNGYGFLWGQKSTDNKDDRYSGFHYFIVSASGKFVIRSYNPQTKKAEPIKEWTDCSHIKTGANSINVLKIMKFDDSIDKQLYFLINDQMIFQTTYLPMFGYETGFIAFQNMKIAIDYFKATFYFDETLIKQ